MLSQAKKGLEVPQAGRGKEGFSIGDFEWNMTLLNLHFRLLSIKAMRTQILLLSHLVCGTMAVLGHEYNDNNMNNNVPYIMCFIYMPVTILSAIPVLIHWSYGSYY